MKTMAPDEQDKQPQTRNSRSRLMWKIVLSCSLYAATVDCTKLQGQTLTTLYSFSGMDDGGRPESPLVVSGSTLYGTTEYGGVSGNGTVFKMNTDGTGFTDIYSFSSSDVDGNAANPYGLLAVSGDVIYGTAFGTLFGTVFKVNADGSGQSPLHIFSGGVDGDLPFGGIILSSNTLYGITEDRAVVFSVHTDGTDFKILHCLSCDTNTNAVNIMTYAGLALSGNYLYGVTFTGGADNLGTLFKVGTDGTGFQILHDFDGVNGANPWAGLTVYNDKLYGTTMNGGGANTVGTVFTINTDGTGFTVLFRFAGLLGAAPQSVLIGTNNVLYGTTTQGGGIGTAGIVFSLNTDGTGFKNLYTFSGGSDGGAPGTGVTLSGNDLYGTTTTGGSFNNGTIFRISLPAPTPTVITRLESNLVVSWPTNSTGLVLQTSTNLSDWITLSNSPSRMNGQFAMTNAISGPHRFFRLNHQ